MRLTQVELARYRQALETCKAGAEVYTRTRVTSECRDVPVADAREAAIAIIEDAVATFGAQAQVYACQLFDEMTDAEGLALEPAVIYDDITDPADVSEHVHWAAGMLVKGDFAGFVRDCAERAGFLVWREAQQCQIRNVAG